MVQTSASGHSVTLTHGFFNISPKYLPWIVLKCDVKGVIDSGAEVGLLGVG